MTGGQPGEPTLAEVQAQYPAWRCARGNNGLFYAQHATIGQLVTGEDPLICVTRSKPPRAATPTAIPASWAETS